MSRHEDLAALLTLHEVKPDLFEGQSPQGTRGRIYGGQVVAQALAAAYATIDEALLTCHSAHCYFIRPGDPRIPVHYRVERARDGKSFATRRVAAIQKGEQIFNFAASFQRPEEGFDHQFTMPDVPSPESLEADTEARITTLSDEMIRVVRSRPMEMRPIKPFTPPEGPRGSGYRIWMRMKDDMGPGAALNQAALAFVSDAGILEASLRPHGMTFYTPGLQAASLDHALWFHRKVVASDWHLYVQDSPSASGARGFTRGSIFRRDGALVASVAQEGLIRLRKPAV